MRLNYAFEQFQGIVQKIRRAIHGRLELLHRFDPFPLLLEHLKSTVLFLQDGLFGIEHQAVRRIHAVAPPVKWANRNRGAFHRAIVRKYE